MTTFNPFTALLDPLAVLSACAQSGALNALPVSVKRSADRTSPKVVGELAKHDEAVEDIFREAIAKASKSPPTKARRIVGLEAA
jgi:hypothetical protein